MKLLSSIFLKQSPLGIIINHTLVHLPPWDYQGLLGVIGGLVEHLVVGRLFFH